MSQNIDWSSTGNYYNNCPIQNYPRFSVFYLQKLEINLKKFSIRSPDLLLLEVGRSVSGPRVGIFDRLTLISDDILKKPEPIFEQTEDWALVHRSLSRALFLQEIWRFLDKKYTYKPFYNYINIDLYLYVKSSHYV